MKAQHLSYADWSVTEYRSAVLSLLGGKVKNGRQCEQLAAQLGAYYAPATVYLLNYARTGLALALAAFQRRRPERSDVLIPAYICPSVVKTVLAAGLNAVPVDIGDDLNLTPVTVAEAFRERTLAVIAPHMFGCPAPIAALETMCRDAGVFLIDDAAQVTGIRQDDRLLGTFGDVGLISFAQSKTIVTGVRGSGGVLLVNNPTFDAELKIACEQLPAPGGRVLALLDFFWNYLCSAHTCQSGDRIEHLAKRLGLALPTPVAQQYARISNLDAGIALAQLPRLDSIIATRQRVAEYYQAALQGQSAIAFPQYAPGRYLARVMLSLPEGVDMVACRRRLRELGVATRPGYKVPFPAQATTQKAESLSARLLGVPCGGAIKHDDSVAICRQLNAAIQLNTSKRKIGSCNTSNN